MPELPEVEIVTQNLSNDLLNAEIISCNVSFGKLIKNMDSITFQSNVSPFHITDIRRKGKYIVFEDSINLKWMTIHLGMTGAFFTVSNFDEIPSRFQKHQHIFFSLKNGQTLVYCDIRKFGDIRLFNAHPDGSYNPFRIMGPDPLNEPDSANFILNSRSRLFADKEIKPSLLDSRMIAGVGNIYACEVLFLTGIHPERLVSTLSDSELKALYAEIHHIFVSSIEQGGSSVSDYVNSKGEKGKFQDFHQIYQKNVCSVCGKNTEKITQNKRSTFFCSHCQPFTRNEEAK